MAEEEKVVRTPYTKAITLLRFLDDPEDGVDALEIAEGYIENADEKVDNSRLSTLSILTNDDNEFCFTYIGDDRYFYYHGDDRQIMSYEESVAEIEGLDEILQIEILYPDGESVEVYSN